MKKLYQKGVLSIIVVLLMIISAIQIAPTAVNATGGDFAGGSGSENDPYLIETKYQLNNVRNDLSAHYKMIADITFTSEDFSEGGDFYNEGAFWSPIGDSITPFSGMLDGGGFAIKNLQVNISSSDAPFAGLFGYIDGGTIKNIGIIDSNIKALSSEAYAGGIAGCVYRGKIIDCYNTGSVTATSNSPTPYSASYVGGIAGLIHDVEITDCYNTGTVSATSNSSDAYAGGITGSGYGILADCHNTGDVTATATSYSSSPTTSSSSSSSFSANAHAGGITGYLYNNATVTNCYNTGSVSVADSVFFSYYAGGIVGYVGEGTIAYCYNTGIVIATSKNNSCVGGIVGYVGEGTIAYCYNTENISLVYEHSGYNSYMGGIAGCSDGGQIINCYNIGSMVALAPMYVGGIVGEVYGTEITNCYNAGSICANIQPSAEGIGGIAGFSSNATIANCYNVGVLLDSSAHFVGGIVGEGWENNLSSCYCLDNVNECVGAVKCTVEQMSQQSTFVGFDFDTVWTMDESSDYPYPTLCDVPAVPAVPAATVDYIKLIALPSTREYYNSNTELSTIGGKICVVFTDGSEIITDLFPYMVSPIDKDVYGKQTLTVTYLGKETSFEIVHLKRQSAVPKSEYLTPSPSDTPVPGTAPSVLTADMLYKGVDEDTNLTNPEWAPHQLRKSWHGYSIAKSAGGVVFGAPTNDNTNFEISYILSDPTRTEEVFANKYYPTMSTVDQPVFGIKFKVNAAAKAQFDKDENAGYLLLEYNGYRHVSRKGVKLKTAAADEWTIVTYDLTNDTAFGSSLGNLNDITWFGYKPLGDEGTLAAGAELTVAYMGFFASEEEARSYTLKTVDITYEDFVFEYNVQKEWDPESHEMVISSSQWEMTSGYVRITNNTDSEVVCGLELRLNEGISGVNAVFKTGSGIIPDNKFTILPGKEQEILFDLYGDPKNFVGGALGVLTVTVEMK